MRVNEEVCYAVCCRRIFCDSSIDGMWTITGTTETGTTQGRSEARSTGASTRESGTGTRETSCISAREGGRSCREGEGSSRSSEGSSRSSEVSSTGKKITLAYGGYIPAGIYPANMKEGVEHEN